MSDLFRFSRTFRRDADVEDWMAGHSDAPGLLAGRWFEVIRECGDDVRELLHDGRPTACVLDAAFAYVDAFTHHVNVGFFRGAELADPDGLLRGSGKFMRHVKVRPDDDLADIADVDPAALRTLILTAYNDMRGRLAAARPAGDLDG